jgi:hypothetical protein
MITNVIFVLAQQSRLYLHGESPQHLMYPLNKQTIEISKQAHNVAKMTTSVVFVPAQQSRLCFTCMANILNI